MWAPARTSRGVRPHSYQFGTHTILHWWAASGDHCSVRTSSPSEDKHVVAVLLAVAEELPADESGRLGAVLGEVSATELHEFLREELIRDHAMCERFFVTFGEETTESSAPDAYRERVDQLFEDHANPVVVEAIDFSRFTDLAQRHRDRGRDEQAAFVYRGLAEGIAANMNRVDANYEHYSSAFQSALDQYLACLREVSLDEEQRHRHADYLATQAREHVDYLAERYAVAREDLEAMQ